MQKSVDLFTTNLNGRKIAFCISLFCTLALTKTHFRPKNFSEVWITLMVQGVPIPFFLFQKLIPQRPRQVGQKFQQFSAFHEVPFHMRQKFFFQKFWKKVLVYKIDQRWRHPSRYHTRSKIFNFCIFRPLNLLVFRYNCCFWIIWSKI